MKIYLGLLPARTIDNFPTKPNKTIWGNFMHFFDKFQ